MSALASGPKTPDLATSPLMNQCHRCLAPSAPHYAYCPKCGLETEYIARRLKTVRYGSLTEQQNI